MGISNNPRRSTSHPGHRQQCRLDLPVLDTETTQLHLTISTTQILDISANPPRQITGAIQPRTATNTRERVGHKPSRRQPSTTQIALRQLVTGHIHLTDHTRRHRPQPVIQNVNRQRRQRPTDKRRISRRHHRPINRPKRHMHRRLGDAIHVHQLRSIGREELEPTRNLLERELLTTEHHIPQRQLRRTTTPSIDQLVERRRRQTQHRHPLGSKHIDKTINIARQVPINDHHPRTRKQRPPQLPHREVERIRMEQRPHIIAAELEILRTRRHQLRHITMSDFHTLGQTRRPRRINHIRPRRRRHHNRHEIGCHISIPGDKFINIKNPHTAADHRPQTMTSRRRISHHHRHTRITNDVLKPVHRIGHIQRQIPRTSLEHTHNRAHHIHRPRRGQPHQITRPHTHSHQTSSHRRRPHIQLGIRQRPTQRRHRHRTTMNSNRTSKQINQRPTTNSHRNRQTSQPLPLSPGQQRHITDRHTRISSHRIQHRQQPLYQHRNRGLIKQIRRIHNRGLPHRTRRHRHIHMQVVLRRNLLRDNRLQLQITHLHRRHRHRTLRHRQHHLRQRTKRLTTNRINRLDHRLERRIRMRKRIQINPANLVK